MRGRNRKRARQRQAQLEQRIWAPAPFWWRHDKLRNRGVLAAAAPVLNGTTLLRLAPFVAGELGHARSRFDLELAAARRRVKAAFAYR